jgi:hypothetical protein
MRNKKAKSLKRLAEHMTIGKSTAETKKAYKRAKKAYKASIGQI